MIPLNHANSREPRILVIGAGAAGCSFALWGRAVGMEVDLVEKDPFPRLKVCGCCLGPIGVEQLKKLGILDSVMKYATKTTHWQGSLGGRQLQLKIPDGIAISRDVLDPIMVEAAEMAGARVRMKCRATIESVDDESIGVHFDQQLQGHRDTERTTGSYDCVVVAAGLRAGNLHGMLPWIEAPHGPFGVSFMASSPDVKHGTIYMACDHDGYVGLVKLDCGRVDVAAALASGSSHTALGDPIRRVKDILARSTFAAMRLEDFTPMMATPPLRRTRVAGCGRIIAIGDAAGYVEPFTGEGMTWAMQNGIASADLVAKNLHCLEKIGDRWSGHVDASVKRRKAICRVMTSLLRSPVACRVAASTLSVFPSLIRPILYTARGTQ